MGRPVAIFARASAATLAPRTPTQRHYVDLLTKEKPYIVIASGAAGSGKTLFATHVGVQKLQAGEVDRLIVTRPTVSVGPDDLGFLPGTLEKKMEPWVRPVFDALLHHYPKSKIERLVNDSVVEIAPLAYMRGRNFERCWIICDEAQNMTPNQMLMMLTRIGEGSKMVITGDPQQFDSAFHRSDANGLTDLLQRLSFVEGEDKKMIETVTFNEGDVQRHPVIPYVLGLYD